MGYKLFAFAVLAMSGFARAQSNPPAWNPGTAYSTGDLVQDNHNVYRAIANAKAGVDPTTNYSYWELASVRYSLTLNIGVGQTFPTLGTAWQYALNATIAQSALLKINIVTTGGNHSEILRKPFSLDHPCGSRISIGGDNPSKIIFEFDYTDGFVIDTGHSLASLSGISVMNANPNPDATIIALAASTKATLPSITNMVFGGFFRSYVLASSGAVMNFVSNDIFNGNIDTLISADGGTIYLPANTTLGGGGAFYGIFATNRARVFVGSGSHINNFGKAAVSADFGSYVNVDGCIISSNAVDVEATHASNVSAIGTSLTISGTDASSHIFSS